MKALLNLTIILGLAYLLYSFAGLAYLLYSTSGVESHSRHLKEDMVVILDQAEFKGPSETKKGKGKEGKLKMQAPDKAHSNLMANEMTTDLKEICGFRAENSGYCKTICLGEAVDDSKNSICGYSFSESSIAGNTTNITSQIPTQNAYVEKNFKIEW